MRAIQHYFSKSTVIAAFCGLMLFVLYKKPEYLNQADNPPHVRRLSSLGNSLSKEPVHPSLHSCNDEMEKRIKELEYINSMLLARSKGAVVGPIPLSSLTESQQMSFNNWNMALNSEIPMGDGTGGKSSPHQAPPQVIEHSLMERTKDKLGWEKKWSKRLVDNLIAAVQRNEDISPRVYPGCALQVQQAFEDYVKDGRFPKENPRILVGGSISPWIESIALATTGVSKVWVMDYQPIDMGDEDRIECVLMEDLQLKKPDELFDIIVSFSSIEHDGLGRYGDPINPNGDLAAVAEFWTLLNPGGLLMLAVPHVNHPLHKVGFVMGNAHRQYSPERIQALSKGFEVIETIEAGTEELAQRFHKPFQSVYIKDKGLHWANQPIIVMRKLTEEVPLMLEKLFSN